MYRLVPLFEHPEKQDSLVKGVDHHVEGSLEDFIVVSVPESISSASANDLSSKLNDEFPDKKVIIFTSNVKFVRQEKLSPNEAARVVKKVEDIIYDKADTSEADTATIRALESGTDSPDQDPPIGDNGSGD